MPQEKLARPSATKDPTRAYKAAREASRRSTSVSKEQAASQLLRNGPKQNETVSYDVVKQDGVSMLKRSIKRSATG